MMLNATQIQLIDKALTKIGICYIDIRLELTDHIAAALEQKDDRFEHHLKGYMLEHKSALKKLNRKFIFIAACKAYKRFFSNIFTLWFVVPFALIFMAALAVNSNYGREDTIMALFYTYVAVSCILSTPIIYKSLRNRDQYSFGFGFSFINLLLFYPSIYMLRIEEDIAGDNVMMLYFTAIISVCIVMHATIRQFDKHYKLRYNG